MDLMTLLSCKFPLLFSSSQVTGHLGEKLDGTRIPPPPIQRGPGSPSAQPICWAWKENTLSQANPPPANKS